MNIQKKLPEKGLAEDPLGPYVGEHGDTISDDIRALTYIEPYYVFSNQEISGFRNFFEQNDPDSLEYYKDPKNMAVFFDDYPLPADNQYVLSDQEKKKLDEANLSISDENHVRQTAFASKYHFMKRFNNFHLYFYMLEEDGSKSGQNVYKRFKILYPEKVNELRRICADRREYIATTYDYKYKGCDNDLFYDLLYQAYKIMTALVDKNESQQKVNSPDPNSAVYYDDWFLCR